MTGMHSCQSVIVFIIRIEIIYFYPAKYNSTKKWNYLPTKVDPQISYTFRSKRLTLCKFSGNKELFGRAFVRSHIPWITNKAM